MMVKKTLIFSIFLSLFFPAEAAVNITDLVQALEVDGKNTGQFPNQIIYNLTNGGDQPVSLSVEVHKAKLNKDGHLDVGEESDDFQIVPESLTVDAGDTAMVSACFDGDTPKKETVYMIGFRHVKIKDKNSAGVKTSVGFDVEQVVYALVYVRTKNMKPNVTQVKYLGNGKIAVTNKGTRAARVGDIDEMVVVDGVSKKIQDLVASPEQAVFADNTRILDIDKSKFTYKTTGKLSKKVPSPKTTKSSGKTKSPKTSPKKSKSKKK